MKLPKEVLEYCNKLVTENQFENVVGFSVVWKPKIKNWRILPIKCIRFYVTAKLPLKELKKPIPEQLLINGKEYLTDVVETRYLKDEKYRELLWKDYEELS